MSPGVANFFSSCREVANSPNAASVGNIRLAPAAISVSTPPGHTALTRIPSGASSAAAERVSCKIAALVAP